jgi:hypothetical protein
MSVEAYDRARAAIARRNGFDAEAQTRIAVFVGAAKGVNATFLGNLSLFPGMTVAQEFIHSQYFREIEFGALFARVTRWSFDPMVYASALSIAAPLWQALWSVHGPVIGPLLDERANLRALALGHALLACVRLTPVIPRGADETEPFVVALRRLDQENGRLIQTQIRLIKDAPFTLGEEEREAVLRAEQSVVDAAFEAFLASLAS